MDSAAVSVHFDSGHTCFPTCPTARLLNSRLAGFLSCRQPQQLREDVLQSLWTGSSCTGRSWMKR
jgi:hypothetical protein